VKLVHLFGFIINKFWWLFTGLFREKNISG